ncbi:B-type cyclin [Tilletia horrida]|nr:B-type cyclin [Tilletia horrida]
MASRTASRSTRNARMGSGPSAPSAPLTGSTTTSIPTSRSAGSVSDHAAHGSAAGLKSKASRVPASVGAGSGRSELQRAQARGALSDRSNVPSRSSSIHQSADALPTKLGKHGRTASAVSSESTTGVLKAKVTATALAARRRLGNGLSGGSGSSTSAPTTVQAAGPVRSRSSSTASLAHNTASSSGPASANVGLGLRRTRGGSITGSGLPSASAIPPVSNVDRTIRRTGSSGGASLRQRSASSSSSGGMAPHARAASMDVEMDGAQNKGKSRPDNGFDDIAEMSADIDRHLENAAAQQSTAAAAASSLQSLAQAAMAAVTHLDEIMGDDEAISAAGSGATTQLLDSDTVRGSSVVSGLPGWTETETVTTPRLDGVPSGTQTPSSPCVDGGEDTFQEPNLDPDHLFTLPPDMELAAQRAVAAIRARYEVEVLQPTVERARAERAEAVRNGTMTAEAAAYENDLVDAGLDPDEVRDTTMVAEYAEEVFAYMAQCEKTTMANPHYMDFQNEMDWSMRATLIDWLMQIHVRYHMLPETLWIAINLADRFLSVRVVSLAKLQLVGVTAMFIAAKYEEILAPTVDDLVRLMTNSGYTRDEILKGERIVLSTLEFNVSKYCSPYSWVRRISKADEYDIQTRTLCKFLIECTLLDHRFLRIKPSTIAAIGMFLAKKMLGGEWNDAFVYYSGFTAEQLLPGANLLLERLLDPAFEDMFVCKKYSIRKFLRASVFAREWVRAHAGGSLNPAAMASFQQQHQQHSQDQSQEYEEDNGVVSPVQTVFA